MRAASLKRMSGRRGAEGTSAVQCLAMCMGKQDLDWGLVEDREFAL